MFVFKDIELENLFEQHCQKAYQKMPLYCALLVTPGLFYTLTLVRKTLKSSAVGATVPVARISGTNALNMARDIEDDVPYRAMCIIFDCP